MRKTIVFFLIAFLSISAYLAIDMAPKAHTLEILDSVKDYFSQKTPFNEGERFTYEVSYNALKIGRSVLTFNGEKELNGKKVYHVTFYTKVPSLKDTEEIYADKDTFLPIEVHRKIKKKVGFSDTIIEKYDQQNFKVDISSKSKLRSKTFSIKKDGPIHNAILLAYYYRVNNRFEKEDRLKITLPTAEFDVIFDGTEKIETPIGELDAYVFRSDPPKFELWLSTDGKYIPLKIKNPGTLGYSLVIDSI